MYMHNNKIAPSKLISTHCGSLVASNRIDLVQVAPCNSSHILAKGMCFDRTSGVNCWLCCEIPCLLPEFQSSYIFRVFQAVQTLTNQPLMELNLLLLSGVKYCLCCEIPCLLPDFQSRYVFRVYLGCTCPEKAAF